MKITRTYPQPDSPSEHLGARERALATLKYVVGLEPEVVNQRHPSFSSEVKERYDAIVELYSRLEGDPRELAVGVLALLLPDARLPLETHPMLPSLEHSFQQVRRKQAGQPLEPSLLELLRG